MESHGIILLVDADPVVLESLEKTLGSEYQVETATSANSALELVEGPTDIDAIIIHVRKKKTVGLDIAGKLRESGCDIPVIFHTGHEDEVCKSGFRTSDQSSGFEDNDNHRTRLEVAVRQAVKSHRLESDGAELVSYARSAFGMVGSSHVMQNIYRTIEKIGPSNGKVMILGPTGTGKELVARALHDRSSRANARLAIFNCNHKSPDLVESELFGHIQGAFTGAVADRIGMFEYAHLGTLFLDEIGDLDFTTQAKLLRVLETGEIQRMGLPDTIKVDVRIMCATHHDLEQMVKDCTFRDDLYYRLKGVTITMSPLCDHCEDIPELIDFFAEQHCRQNGIDLKIFSPEARDLLIEYHWPGNVRQLGDTIQSLIDVVSSYYISSTDVSQFLGFNGIGKLEGLSELKDSDLSSQLRCYKRILIIKALDRANHNVAAAARMLSLDPSNLRKLIKELNLH